MKNLADKNINSYLKFVYSENDTLSIIFQNNELFSGVLGEFNNNIKELEKITKTNIYTRGNSISFKTDQKNNEKIKSAIVFLAERYLINGSLEKKDIHSSVDEFMTDKKIDQNNKIQYLIKTPKKSVIPRSEKQKNYVKALHESDIVISLSLIHI